MPGKRAAPKGKGQGGQEGPEPKSQDGKRQTLLARVQAVQARNKKGQGGQEEPEQKSQGGQEEPEQSQGGQQEPELENKGG